MRSDQRLVAGRALRARLVAATPVFGRTGVARNGGCADAAAPAGDPAAMGGAAFASPVRDFYRTDSVSRASRTMAELSALFAQPAATAAAAE